MSLAWKGNESMPMLLTFTLEGPLMLLGSDGPIAGRDEKHFVGQPSIGEVTAAKITSDVRCGHVRWIGRCNALFKDLSIVIR
jgi:hypothetical protein